MPQVFICYSHKDKRFVDQLVADLNGAGVKTWRDVDNIPGHVGSNTAGWRNAVNEGLRTSDTLIVVLSPDSVASQEVEAEWNWFLASRKPVFPVLIRECDIPYRLMALQYWDFRGDNGTMLNSLADRLKGVSDAPPPPRRAGRGLAPVIGGALAFILLVAGLYAFGVIGGDRANPTPTETPSSTTPDPPTESPTEEAIPTGTSIPAGFQARDEQGVLMAWIQAGTFNMGFDTDLAFIICQGSGGDCETNDTFTDEEPIHSVTLAHSFWMDVYEATNGEYQTCVDAGICQAPESSRSAARTSYYGNRAFSRYPVIFVTWEMADTFCRDWRGGRLPTEAEWEYAARSVQEVIYPWGNSSVAPGRLNFCDSGCPFDFADGRFEDGFPDDTSPVGHYEDGASPFGILDMAGNVYEWVADWHGAYSSEAAIDPTGPADGFQKVRRGGAWSNSASFVRLSNRAVGGLSFADDDTGFRCVRDGE